MGDFLTGVVCFLAGWFLHTLYIRWFHVEEDED